ncbi:Serine protease 42 [Bulinus truncatus]|nr:Serine protease 42 [Bulinus truncatus]
MSRFFHIVFILIGKIDLLSCIRRCDRFPSLRYPIHYYKDKYDTWLGSPYNRLEMIEDSRLLAEKRRLHKLPCGFSATDPGQAIIGGPDAVDNAWPWFVYIKRRRSGPCGGGALIDAKWVLTAASCLKRSIEYLRLGSMKKNNTIRSAASIIIHEGYNNLTQVNINDLALVKLSSPVTYTRELWPICITENEVELEDLAASYVTGYGAKEADNPEPSENLQQLRVPISPQSMCAYLWRVNNITVDSRQICTERISNKGICYYDTGSPLSCKVEERYYLAGLASMVAFECSHDLIPDVYT